MVSNVGFHKMAAKLSAKGRGPDTLLAHITPAEAALLKREGGRGSRNPHTGLLEFIPNDGNRGGGGRSEGRGGQSAGTGAGGGKGRKGVTQSSGLGHTEAGPGKNTAQGSVGQAVSVGLFNMLGGFKGNPGFMSSTTFALAALFGGLAEKARAAGLSVEPPSFPKERGPDGRTKTRARTAGRVTAPEESAPAKLGGTSSSKRRGYTGRGGIMTGAGLGSTAAPIRRPTLLGG